MTQRAPNVIFLDCSRLSVREARRLQEQVRQGSLMRLKLAPAPILPTAHLVGWLVVLVGAAALVLLDVLR